MTTTVYYTKLRMELFNNSKKLVELPAGWYHREINSNGDAEMKLLSTDPARKRLQSSNVTWCISRDTPEDRPVEIYANNRTSRSIPLV